MSDLLNPVFIWVSRQLHRIPPIFHPSERFAGQRKIVQRRQHTGCVNNALAVVKISIYNGLAASLTIGWE